MTKKNNIQDWFKDNAWNLAVTAFLIAMAWATLNLRVSNIEAQVSEYPHQEWFELKFQTIEKSISDIQKSLEQHVNP